uniref:Uncharacterized protein n=1 Tax=Poecilia reticulata TaxID=8081 RepID=A0A3P9QAB5_POERE
MAGGRQEKDLVHLNAIHVESVKKERRYQKLHTEFSINPYRKCNYMHTEINNLHFLWKS